MPVDVSYTGRLINGGLLKVIKTYASMLSKALEMGVCFHRGPAFGAHGGALLS